jgi:hypothetical protein
VQISRSTIIARTISYRLLFLLVGLAGLLSSSGCTTSKLAISTSSASTGAFPDHSLAFILEQLPAFPEALDRVKLEALVSVSSPEMDGQFTTIAEVKRRDSLFARIKFPLGIEGARVLITRDSAFTFDRIANIVFRGSSGKMKAIIPGSLISLDMVEQALGFFLPDSLILWNLKSDGTKYYLHSPDESIRYTVDPQSWRIEHIQLRDRAGIVTEQRWFLDFREMDGILVPSRMILVQPALETRLSVALRSLVKNPGAFHFDLGIRADTKWKDLNP